MNQEGTTRTHHQTHSQRNVWRIEKNLTLIQFRIKHYAFKTTHLTSDLDLHFFVVVVPPSCIHSALVHSRVRKLHVVKSQRHVPHTDPVWKKGCSSPVGLRLVLAPVRAASAVHVDVGLGVVSRSEPHHSHVLHVGAWRERAWQNQVSSCHGQQGTIRGDKAERI